MKGRERGTERNGKGGKGGCLKRRGKGAHFRIFAAG